MKSPPLDLPTNPLVSTDVESTFTSQDIVAEVTNSPLEFTCSCVACRSSDPVNAQPASFLIGSQGVNALL